MMRIGGGRSSKKAAMAMALAMALAMAMAMEMVLQCRAATEAVFVFGDSLVDVGNNNYLPLGMAKASHLPNGIDFPTTGARTPTGRFTNGLTIPDMLGLKAGLKGFVPPYLAPSSHGRAIAHGVNYASGGGGILNETGRIFIQRLSLDQQIDYFRNTKVELAQVLGSEKAVEDLVNGAIFSMTIGANDYINNYVSPLKDTADIFLPSHDFSVKVLTQYKAQLMTLYGLGARKFIVVNVPLIGCIPYQRSLQFGTGGKCNERANRVANEFNLGLKDLLNELNAHLPGAMFLYADAYNAQLHILDNYQQYGFEYADRPCCGALGSKNGIINCRSFINACPDRSKYFFWDPYHPSQAGYKVLADEFFSGHTYISPMNLQQLIEL